MAWPKMNKNAIFGPNLDFYGQKILIFTGEIKSFVTHIRKTHLGTLFTLVFGQTLDKMCKKWQYLAQNDQKCRFWTKFGRFSAKNPNFYGSKSKFWYPYYGRTTKAPCLHCFFGWASDQMG